MHFEPWVEASEVTWGPAKNVIYSWSVEDYIATQQDREEKGT